MEDEIVFVINVPTIYCPICGYRFTWHNQGQIDDFKAHAAHSCPHCGTRFQYVSGDTITEVARKAGGDL